MVGIGNNSEEKSVSDDQVDSFLQLFDGDYHAAVKALYSRRSHDNTLRIPAVTSKAKVEIEPSGTVLYSIDSLVKEYKVGRQKISALNGVSLDVREGEFIALTGPSGSGKSTLLQLMGGLDKATSGAVTVDGVNIGKLRDKKLSRFRGQTIGFVFQFFYLQPFLNLGRNIEVPGMFSRQDPLKRKIKAVELTSAVGLSDRIKHYPRELSGGQMQRAAIARALLNNPKVLLADEPTGNLDSVNSKAIIDLFEQIRKDYGTTIVIVTHDPVVAARADREIKMLDGKIV